ncbi:hypothetical protein SAMN02745127_00471 [Oceanospirillum multiglobuliferum]|uniref:Uncharacterized protein n=1 Tax=Oceanospirillum multiglobuliferum TaxID=64969 RepID=A0A1T4LHE9_9GAMM|nr:hypothetical protein [Oceanospirillum multiglobuliferum]OPX56663.1 hypothetical protein BTE48_01825 [Oceanospirillum multiglobuliferum]SJZ53967.1 hypothetical protein SAMN02745127_00471 [Oceanospirillum multiglobuliferum]
MIGQILKNAYGNFTGTHQLSVKNVDEHQSESPKHEQQNLSQNFSSSEQVKISSAAQSLNENNDALSSDWKGVKTLATRLRTTLDAIFLASGVDTSTPIKISVDPSSGKLRVGNHPDKARIESLLNERADVGKQIFSVSSVANYSYQTDKLQQVQESTSLNSSLPNNGIGGEVNTQSMAKVSSALRQYKQAAQEDRLNLIYDNTNGISFEMNNRLLKIMG